MISVKATFVEHALYPENKLYCKLASKLVAGTLEDKHIALTNDEQMADVLLLAYIKMRDEATSIADIDTIMKHTEPLFKAQTHHMKVQIVSKLGAGFFTKLRQKFGIELEVSS